MSERIAVTGLGVVAPFGDSAAQFRDALLRGDSAIARDPEFAEYGCRSTLSVRVAGFEPSKWVAPMKLRRMDTTGPFALAAIRQAMDDARYLPTPAGDDDTGVVLGTCSAGGQATYEYVEALWRGGPSGAPALLFNSTVGNAATGLAGLEYKLCGPNATISQKEASGLAAIAAAVDLLRLGRAASIVAGGVDAIFDIFYRAHDRFGVMNPGQSSGCATAPFSTARSGFVMGEGAYMLWLQPSTDAGGRAHGEVLGTGAASAVVGLNAWPQEPGDLARTMRLALADAGLTAHDVGVVYASANADPALDAVEARALVEVFGDARPIVTSIKGAIGECGASGAAACAAALLCGAAGLVPPVAGLQEPDAAASPLQIARTAVQSPGEIVLVNSVASGGALCSVVLRVPRQH